MKIQGVNLVEFLEKKHQRRINMCKYSESYYKLWSKNMDYENWYIDK